MSGKRHRTETFMMREIHYVLATMLVIYKSHVDNYYHRGGGILTIHLDPCLDTILMCSVSLGSVKSKPCLVISIFDWFIDTSSLFRNLNPPIKSYMSLLYI